MLLGALLAWVTYGQAPAGSARNTLALALLRAAAVCLVSAIVLGAPLAPPRSVAPVLAVDVSRSTLRTHSAGETEEALRARISHIMTKHAVTQLLAFGDSLREGGSEIDGVMATALQWRDYHSVLRPAVDRAAAMGKPILVLTDGEISDPDVFREALPGSMVIGDSLAEREDAAVTELRVRTTAVRGDTLDMDIVATAGSAGAPAGDVQLLVQGRVVSAQPLPTLESGAVARIPMRFVVPGGVSHLLVQAVVNAASDYERGNDTLGVIVDVSDRPQVVFLSTAPDVDVREVLRVLRGSLNLNVRAFLRLAPQLWLEEGGVNRLTESEVVQRARQAGMVIIHGDTAFAGLNNRTQGARALWSPALPPAPARAGEVQRETEWYPSRAPLSPVAAVLSGLPWDSLMPVRMSGAAKGDYTVLEVRAGRSGAPVAAIAAAEGRTGGVRTVVISGSGYASWALHSGRQAEAFDALWGAVFDWLAAARSDERKLVPAVSHFREGEPIRWRRSSPDSVVSVSISRQGTAASAADSITVRFVDGQTEAESKSLPKGVYTVQSSGGSSMFVVNAPEELLPAAVTLQHGSAVSGNVTSTPPRATDRAWPFAVALVLLSLEWLLRRYAGFR